MKFYAITDRGKVRETNQDQAFVMQNINKDYLGIVCDGMGGHKAGAYASLLCSKIIMEHFLKCDKFTDYEEASSWLYDTIMIANNEIKNKAEKDKRFEGMGTTLCIALITKGRVIIANVGDSRAYTLYQDDFSQITDDQTLVNVLRKSKMITHEEAANHPNKHVLMFAVGTMDEPQIDIYNIEKSEYILMLCSDGIYNLVNEKYIKTILESRLPIEKKALSLIEDANANGGYDNMAVVLMEVQ